MYINVYYVNSCSQCISEINVYTSRCDKIKYCFVEDVMENKSLLNFLVYAEGIQLYTIQIFVFFVDWNILKKPL